MAHIPTATHEKFDGKCNGIFKPARQTLDEPIEFNDDFTILEIKMQYEYLNTTNKVYTHIINKSWLYEQPQSTKLFLKRANVPNASTPLKTMPMNPKTLTKHIVPLHILGSNLTTPKYGHIIGCKKGPVTPCSSRSTRVK
jgi:hypothetical protein